MLIQPYLIFNGRCEEALTFYKNAVDAEELMLMRYKDSPEPLPPGMVPPESEDKIMHVSFRIGESIVMASDGDCAEQPGASGQPEFLGVSLSLSVATEAEAKRYFAALAEGGQVQMPLEKTFWSPCFGTLCDRFGVSWMVNVEDPNQA